MTKSAPPSTRTRTRNSGRGRDVRREPTSKTPWLIIGAVALVIVLGLVYLLTRPSDALAGVQTFPNQERGHSPDVQNYAQTPPVGGVHTPEWQNCGVYDKPIRKERGVHSMEHGAVWITYQPDLPADQVAKLREIVQSRPFTLLSPYPGLPSPVVASAWGVQLKLNSATDSQLEKFVAQYVQGPQTPEPGAACTGGTSATE